MCQNGRTTRIHSDRMARGHRRLVRPTAACGAGGTRQVFQHDEIVADLDDLVALLASRKERFVSLFAKDYNDRMNTISQTTKTPTQPKVMVWTLASLGICFLGVVGSLWLSLGMNLKACPLCLYQRTFIMAVGGVLLTGLFTQLRSSSMLPLLALPAAIAGFGVAVFHEYLEVAGMLECPAGLAGMGTAPQQSLGVFVILVAALSVGSFLGRNESGNSTTAVFVAFVLGLLFAAGTIKSAPPMPAAPTAPYEKPLDMCRPPYNPE